MPVSTQLDLQIEITEAGNKLLLFLSSLPELLNHLDQVQGLLSKVEQTPNRSMLDALFPSMKALICEELLRHSDMDVKVSVASCMSEIIRITAPNAPYNDEQMKEIFQLNVMALRNLSCESSRCYSKAIQILDNTAKVKSILLMLDLECNLLVVDMFQQFLNTIRSNHPHVVFRQMEDIMTSAIKESEELSSDLPSLLLSSVKKENQNVSPLCWKLGENVLKNCAVELQPSLPAVVKSTNLDFDKYSDIVASICQGAPGKEHEVAEEAGPSIDGQSNSEMDHDSTQSMINGTLKNKSSLNTLDGCHQVKKQEYNDARSKSEPEYSDAIRTVQVQTDPVIPKKRTRKPNSLLKLDEGYYCYWTTERTKSDKEPRRRKNPEKIIGSSPKSSSLEQSALQQTETETNTCIVSSKALHTENASASASQRVSDTDKMRTVQAETDSGIQTKRSRRPNSMLKLEEGYYYSWTGERKKSLKEPRRRKNHEKKIDSSTSEQSTLQQAERESNSCTLSSVAFASQHDSTTVPGKELVGCRIKVWWPLDEMFYEGDIYSFDPSEKKHQVIYADGAEEILDLSDECWELLENVSLYIGQHADLPHPSTISHKSRRKKAKANAKSVSSAKQEHRVSSSKRRRSLADKSKTEAPKAGSCDDDSTPDALCIADVAKDDISEVDDKQKSTVEAESETQRIITKPKLDTADIVVKSESQNISSEKLKSPQEEKKGKSSDLVYAKESETSCVKKRRRSARGK